MAENPYIRIIKAAKEGVGVRLTAEECYYLAQDDSIVQVAARTAVGEESNGGGFVVTKAGFVDTPSPQQNLEGPQPCGIADPSTRDCPNMKEVGGGMDGERYRCDVCGKGYFLDYEEMK